MKKIVYVCDRCGKQIKSENTFLIHEIDSNMTMVAGLCDDCSNELHEILLRFGFQQRR